MASDGTEPDRPPVRASDADRQRVVDLLHEHAAAGRLTLDEYEQRVEQAYAARTLVDLRPLLADLPVDLDAMVPLKSPPPAPVVPRPSGAVLRAGTNPKVWMLICVLAIVGLVAASVQAGAAPFPFFVIGAAFFMGRRRYRRPYGRGHRC